MGKLKSLGFAIIGKFCKYFETVLEPLRCSSPSQCYTELTIFVVNMFDSVDFVDKIFSCPFNPFE